MEPKRYDPVVAEDCDPPFGMVPSMLNDPGGRFIHYMDYKNLRARLAEVEAQRDELKDALIFVIECDWEESANGGGGDNRIGPAIRKALAKLEAHDGK